MSNKAHR